MKRKVSKVVVTLAAVMVIAGSVSNVALAHHGRAAQTTQVQTAASRVCHFLIPIK